MYASYNFQLVMLLGATLFLEIGSAPAKRAGQGEGGGCTQRLLLGLAIESFWLTLSRPFLSSFAMYIEKWFSGHAGPPFLAVKLISLWRGNHWPRAVTIESLLESGCGLSQIWMGWLQWHCGKSEASKSTWSGNMVRLGDPQVYKGTSIEKNSPINQLWT